MAEMKTLNGYEIVDAKAREEIKKIDSIENKIFELFTFLATSDANVYLVSNSFADKVDFVSKLKNNLLVRWNGPSSDTYISPSDLDFDKMAWIDASGNYTYTWTTGNYLYDDYVYVLQGKTLFAFESIDNIRNAITSTLKYDNTTSGLTATTVKAAIDELASRPTGGDGGANTFYLDFSDASASEKASTDEMKAFYNAYINGDNPIAYIKTSNSGGYYRPAIIKQLSNSSSLTLQYQPAGFELYECLVNKNAVNYDDISLSATAYRSNGWSQFYLQQSGGGASWTTADSEFDSNLYNAKEIYILAESNQTYITSYVAFRTDASGQGGYIGKVGDCTYMRFTFTLPYTQDLYDIPKWYYDGSGIQLETGSADVNLLYIAYK